MTQAAPAMSPFMSSMPAAGLIEMPPVSKHTPLPMKATGASPFLPPFQRITTTRLVARRALPDAEQRVHAELLQRGHVEHLDRDAGFLERLRAAGEFLRVEDVGRLVDQVARQPHAAGDRFACGVGLARGRGIGDGDGDAAAFRLVLVVVFALGLVAVEGVGAQRAGLAPDPPPVARSWRRPAVRQRRWRRRRRAGSLPSALPPSITMSLGARPLGFADAEHHQARGLEPRRNAQFQRRAAFAAEVLGPGGARDMVDGGGDRFATSPARI